MKISLYDPEYTVRSPSDRPRVSETKDGEWIAYGADGSSRRGATPASAISMLRK